MIRVSRLFDKHLPAETNEHIYQGGGQTGLKQFGQFCFKTSVQDEAIPGPATGASSPVIPFRNR